jgi:hypothetical protein
MRLHSVLRAASFLFAAMLLAPWAAAQEKSSEVRYKFRKGEVIKYEVTSVLDINQAGSNAAFLTNGNDRPLTWTVNGTFENKVLDVNEADGTATLERSVRKIDSMGHAEGPTGIDRFKFSWNGEKDKNKPDESKITSLMDRFIVNMITTPVQYTVSAEGLTSGLQDEHMKRLVMRRGMMSWPVRGNEMSWSSFEDIAVPVLHDKIKLEFKNTVTQDATGGGAKIRKITAPVSLKNAAKTEGMGFDGLTFTATGQAKVDFDMTNGRLHRLDLDLTIRFSGKGPIDGGEGDIKGVATYKETQVYKD